MPSRAAWSTRVAAVALAFGGRCRGALVVCALVGATSCRSTPAPPKPIDPTFEPAFVALQQALDAHDDVVAQGVLERVLARRPQGGTLERAEAYGRILRGRQLAAAIELKLLVEPLPASERGAAASALDLERQAQVTLLARHSETVALRIETGPGTLRTLTVGIDRFGTEEMRSTTHTLPQLSRIDVPPGVVRAIDLGRFRVPASIALGTDVLWDLRLPPGTLRIARVRYPAAELRVAGARSHQTAAWLPQAPVEAAELVRYVERGAPNTAALIERCVRIDPQAREAALTILTPAALALGPAEFERLIPCLRWLSGRRDLGADEGAWRAFLDGRRRLADAAPAPAE